MLSRRLSLLYRVALWFYPFQSLFIPFYPFLSPSFSTMLPGDVYKEARLRPFCGFWRAFLLAFFGLGVYFRQSLQGRAVELKCPFQVLVGLLGIVWLPAE